MRCVIFNHIRRFYQKVFKNQPVSVELPTNTSKRQYDANIKIIPRDQHIISRKNINENALKVLHRLQKSGYEAYLVGGSVRDLLLALKPKDFDIATNATPEQVRHLFRNCRLVGRRFRLAHIIFGRDIIEVATFRGEHSQAKADKNTSQQSHNGMLLRDNVYGSIKEDAYRRDFTINALYYNSKDFTLRDYTGGLEDLQQGIIRLIGDAETRYREDPVRMLRAVRFAAKLKMKIAPATAEPIPRLTYLLKDIPAARLYEELLKLLQSGEGVQTYRLLCKYSLFQQLLPVVTQYFTEQHDSNMERLILLALENTDKRILSAKRVNPAFLLAAILWYPLKELAEKFVQESGLNYNDSFALAANEMLNDIRQYLAIPKRVTTTMRSIWQLQLRLPYRDGKKALRLLELPKFRAGFDLLQLRGEIEKGETERLANWWQAFQNAEGEQINTLLNSVNPRSGGQARRKPRNYNRNTNPGKPT